jgi:hypothetical protein
MLEKGMVSFGTADSAFKKVSVEAIEGIKNIFLGGYDSSSYGMTNSSNDMGSVTSFQELCEEGGWYFRMAVPFKLQFLFQFFLLLGE